MLNILTRKLDGVTRACGGDENAMVASRGGHRTRRDIRVRANVLYRHKIVSWAALIAPIAIAGAAASQPQSNSLVPGIAPYSPPKAAAAAPGPVSPTPASPSLTNSAANASLNASASTGEPASGYEYILGSGDKVRIIVYGETDLTGEFYVSGNGSISFPLIGDVPASGKTLGQVRDEIETSLRSGYIKDPRVSAEVLTFRPYYIFGEVGKPGEYPYSDGITVLNAVATAGGFTYRANAKYVLLKHPNDAKELKVLLTGGLKIGPGDSVRVVQRYF